MGVHMRSVRFTIHSRLFLAAALVLCALCAVAGCSGSGTGTPRSGSVRGGAAKLFRDEGAARDALFLVNEERVNRGMQPLVRRTELDAVAYAHARDLVRMNELSHTSSDGRKLENRLDHLEWEWAGENLARNKGFEAPAREAVKGWIASPKHFENMFRPDFSQTGVAALYDPDSGFTYFVQVFVIPVQ